jgi:hypothetical protein
MPHGYCFRRVRRRWRVHAGPEHAQHTNNPEYANSAQHNDPAD